MNKPYALGVDVGGTFTDCVLYNEETSEMKIRKVLSTPRDPSIGVFEGIDLLLEVNEASMEQVSRVIHGTTLVANAVIERNGASVGMITTKGFPNVLDMRREWRYDNYDFHIKFPEPLVPNYLRREVEERVWYDGTVHTPLNEQQVVEATRELVEEGGVESIAICFLHSYAHPLHELVTKKLVKDEYPELHVTTSSEIAPHMREFERFSTTVINAYTLPLVDGYLDRMEMGLKERGFGREKFSFFVIGCSGGLVRSDVARALPVLLLESGPVAGVRIANYIGKRMGYGGMLSFDMGGTTAKGCIIKNGQAEVAYEFEVARIHRFKAGSGYPVVVPNIRLIEMGAGGGSIAEVDSRGVLKVGPKSVGAEPGPACYSLGGRKATVTDTDLLLGYLNRDYFLGGQIRLNAEKAEKVVQEAVADPLDMSLMKAAYGIYDVVNQNISQAFRIHAAEIGVDMRRFDLFAFGGAGPVHAWKVAADLYISRIIVPFEAGISSAMGLLITPLAFDFARTRRMALEDLTPERFNDVFDLMVNERTELLRAAGVPPDMIEVFKALDMRYRGQGFYTEVRLPEDLDPTTRHLKELFESEYERIYTLTAEGVPIEVCNFKGRVSGPEFELLLSHRSEIDLGDPFKGEREAYFGEESGFLNCSVYDRHRLRPGVRIKGPSIVEETTSTCVIPPEARATIDGFYNLVIRLR
ncbi:MAG: hydantoinase/oxoprolinase family protein [Promethearchaeota archaeon]|jgi:N-methylhydantoinase A